MQTNAVAEVVKNIADSSKHVKVSDLGSHIGESMTGAVAKNKAKGGIISFMKRLIVRLFTYFTSKKNWTKPGFWIGIFFMLRAMQVFAREYGLTLFKKQISGQHVFLTGAGSGIGRLMAIRLGQMGCKMSLSDINVQGLEETKQLMIKEGIKEANICIFQCDVSKKESIVKSAQIARAAFGSVQILINNAGIVSGKTTLELTESMIDRTMSVNTIAILHTIKEFLPEMIANKQGHIVTIASMAGLAGVPGLSDYCASKSGAIAIDEAVRLELKKNGHYRYVKTTCICPNFINTGMFDGAKSAFPLYILSPEETVDRIIAAIQQEEIQVIIPWRGNVVHLVRLLPLSVMDKIGSVLGLGNTMDDFMGKGNVQQRLPGIKASNAN